MSKSDIYFEYFVSDMPKSTDAAHLTAALDAFGQVRWELINSQPTEDDKIRYVFKRRIAPSHPDCGPPC